MHIKKKVFILFSISIFLLLLTNNVFCQTYNIPVNGVFTDPYDLPVTCSFDSNQETNPNNYCILENGNYLIKDKIYLDLSFDNIGEVLSLDSEDLNLLLSGSINLTLAKDNFTNNSIFFGSSNTSSSFDSLIIDGSTNILEDFDYPYTIDIISYIDKLIVLANSNLNIYFDSLGFYNFIFYSSYNFSEYSNVPLSSDYYNVNDFNMLKFLDKQTKFFGGELDFSKTKIINLGSLNVDINHIPFEISYFYDPDEAFVDNRYKCDLYNTSANDVNSYIYNNSIYNNTGPGDSFSCYEFYEPSETQEINNSGKNFRVKKYNYFIINSDEGTPDDDTAECVIYNEDIFCYESGNIETYNINIKPDNEYIFNFKDFNNQGEFKLNSSREDFIINDYNKQDEDLEPTLISSSKSIFFIEDYKGSNLPKTLDNNNLCLISTCQSFSQLDNSGVNNNSYYNLSKLIYFSPDSSNSNLQSHINNINGLENVDYKQVDCSQHLFVETESGFFFYMSPNLKLNPFLITNIYDYNINDYLNINRFKDSYLQKYSNFSNNELLSINNKGRNNIFYINNNFITQKDYNLTDMYDLNICVDYFQGDIFINKLFGLYNR